MTLKHFLSKFIIPFFLILLCSCRKDQIDLKPAPNIDQKIKERLPQKKVIFKKEDISPEGFNWIHRDLALVYSRVIYEHGLKGVWRKNPLIDKKEALNSYLLQTEKISGQQFKKWPLIHRKSFALNQYHARVIQAIIKANGENLKDEEIGKISFQLFSQSYTLEKFKKEVLYPLFSTPQFLFSLKCFSNGCPEFRNTIVNYRNLENILKSGQERFFIDKTKHYFEENSKTIVLSPYLKEVQQFSSVAPQKWRERLSLYFAARQDITKQLAAGVPITYKD